MTEQELIDAEEAQIKYKTAWIEAEYAVAGWPKIEANLAIEEVQYLLMRNLKQGVKV